MRDKRAVRMELEALAKALERTKREIPAGDWRTGITPDPTVARVARRACAAWAWILQHDLDKRNFAGGTHFMDLGRWSARTPWARLNAFAAWAMTLPGDEEDPTEPTGGEFWIWALRRVVAWLRTPAANSAAPTASRAAPATVPDGATMTVEEKALAVLVTHPGWTLKQIAKAAGCHEKTLSVRRYTRFRTARQALREQGKRDLARGSKHREPDGEHADLEAWDEGPDT
jgi:AraC-like DNA-binding protein